MQKYKIRTRTNTRGGGYESKFKPTNLGSGGAYELWIVGVQREVLRVKESRENAKLKLD